MSNFFIHHLLNHSDYHLEFKFELTNINRPTNNVTSNWYADKVINTI